MDDVSPALLFLALSGFVGGILLFGRGLVAYRRDRIISSVATSSLDGIAAGEVRVSGVVETLEQTLVSPLQSRPCVWYRARVETTDDQRRLLLDEERAVSFRISDGQDRIRVVPQGARWEIDDAFDESTGVGEIEPLGLDRHDGPRYSPALEVHPDRMTETQRQAAIEALLTVDQGAASAAAAGESGGRTLLGAGLLGSGRRFREARLEPGMTVTVIGQALPWADLAASQASVTDANVDRAIAADIAAARAEGILAATTEQAWGNAAIPGFGIGRPTQLPALDLEAHQPALEDPDAFDDSLEPYRIPENSLVLSRSAGSTMAIYLGAPEAAMRHHDLAFLLGICGAVMAIVSALGLGSLLAGTL